jgi:hypothetical protein
MNQVRLSLAQRWSLWSRSVVLADLSRRMPLQKLLKWYTPSSPSPEWSKLPKELILSCIDDHLQKCRRMKGRRCLRRGLLVFYFLRLAGYDARLHFGYFVQQAGNTQTHCWNTVENLVDDPPKQRCVELMIWTG